MLARTITGARKESPKGFLQCLNADMDGTDRQDSMQGSANQQPICRWIGRRMDARAPTLVYYMQHAQPASEHGGRRRLLGARK